MTIYVNSYRDNTQEHQGYSYHTTKRESHALKRTQEKNGGECEVSMFKFSLTKRDVLRALRRVGSHPDNG